MLAIEDLRVSYGRVQAVRGLSLEVNDGEIVGVVGPNGAGKSTTLMTIMGVIRPQSGKIVFDDRSLVGLAPERIVRRGLALVPEGRRILATLTVEENLRLAASTRRDRAAVKQDIEANFARFPILKAYYDIPAGRLSGGEQQQLAIARALLAKPRLLLLDEPSLGLAPQMVDLVFDALEQLRADGTTLLLVEQNAAMTIELADRTYVLRTGRVELHGTREELLARTDLEAAYLGA